MTMPNPVAEVVERLRAKAVNRCDPTSWAGQNGLTVEKTTEWIAADLIERLSRERDTVIEECIEEAQAEANAATSLLDQNVFVSEEAKNMLAGQRTVAESIVKNLRNLQGQPRERDTGVPEGWKLCPMIGADVRASSPASTFEVYEIRAERGEHLYVRGEETIWYHIENVKPAAAPQPPTISDQHSDPFKPGWLAKDVERAVRRCEELGLAERQVTHPAQPLSDGLPLTGSTALTMQVSTLTRERDQAREALAETRDLIEDLADRALEELKADRERKFDPYDAPDDCESCITVTFGELRKATKRARSVLHPEPAPSAEVPA